MVLRKTTLSLKAVWMLEKKKVKSQLIKSLVALE